MMNKIIVLDGYLEAPPELSKSENIVRVSLLIQRAHLQNPLSFRIV